MLPLLFYFLDRSESPSQVFIIVLSWLFTILKCMNPLNWGGVFLAYDNMCHLDGLKAAENPLPWAAPWDRAWMFIQKMIDSLDIRNHKDQSCKESYNPANLKKELPDGNTMAAEQTFVWLSHFKKILCAMPKVHHLFYLHRIVKRRNRYATTCYRERQEAIATKGSWNSRQNWEKLSALLGYSRDKSVQCSKLNFFILPLWRSEPSCLALTWG